jgi:hypothetical protein
MNDSIGVEYDHKADMYALGIIFFEMWRPFSSGMERAIELGKLRSTGLVPTEFVPLHTTATSDGQPASAASSAMERENIRKIIEWLLKVDPNERPTAADLLKSGLIPLKIEDEYIESALKTMTTRDSPYHQRLVDQLFSAPSDELLDFTFDYDNRSSLLHGHGGAGGGMIPEHVRCLMQQAVFDRIITLLRCHGCMHMSTSILFPKSSRVPEKKNAAYVLDPSGNILQLPFFLTVPFARWLAQRSAQLAAMIDGNTGHHTHHGGGGSSSSNGNRLLGGLYCDDGHSLSLDLRRYDIAKVYRRNPTLGQPRDLYECDFDLVWMDVLPAAATVAPTRNSHPVTSPVGGSGGSVPAKASPTTKKDARTKAREKGAAVAAESIKMIDQVIMEFGGALGNHFIRLNHLDLFDMALDCVLAMSAASTAAASTSSGGLSSRSMSGIGSSSSHAHHPIITTADGTDIRIQIRALSSMRAVENCQWTKSGMRKQLMAERILSHRSIDALGAILGLKSAPVGNL